jgi:sulfate permease, SulP family
LVSLPLSTALAIASGAEPMQGISTGIWGSGMGGLFGGSNYNILGPAGALVNNLSELKR